MMNHKNYGTAAAATMVCAFWLIMGAEEALAFASVKTPLSRKPIFLSRPVRASQPSVGSLSSPSESLLLTPLALSASSSDASENSTPLETNMNNNTVTTPSTTTPEISASNLNGDIDKSAAATTKQPPFPVVLWKFTRPHTIIGSALAIPALHMLAAPSLTAAFTKKALSAMAYAMIPALLMNLYITGLNQITDVEIDKINKPNLPIAAGILSMKHAIAIVMVSLVLSLGLGAAHPTFGTEGLNAALWLSGILGTVYSLPPFRFKRFPVLAAFCIVSVRGFVINASFFAHSVAAAYGGLAASSGAVAKTSGSIILDCLRNNRACFLSSLFFGVFGLVIALMKDVPDVAGDREANVRTFSVRLGQKQVYTAMRRLLSVSFYAVGAAFLRSATVASSGALTACRVATSVAAMLAGWSVRREAQGVDPEDSQQVYDYYMHLWKLFYLSYFVLPFAR